MGNSTSQEVYQGDPPFRRKGWKDSELETRAMINPDPRGPRTRGQVPTFNNKPTHILNRGPETYDQGEGRRIHGGRKLHGIPGSLYVMHGRPHEGPAWHHPQQERTQTSIERGGASGQPMMPSGGGTNVTNIPRTAAVGTTVTQGYSGTSYSSGMPNYGGTRTNVNPSDPSNLL